MPRIPHLEHFQRREIPHFPHQNAFGSQPHGDFGKTAHINARHVRGLQRNRVGRTGLQFRGIFQNHQPIRRREARHGVNDRVQKRGFAAGRATHHNDVVPGRYGSFNEAHAFGADGAAGRVLRQRHFLLARLRRAKPGAGESGGKNPSKRESSSGNTPSMTG